MSKPLPKGVSLADPRTDQLAPHSIEAEEATLGAILISEEALDELAFLEPEDFFLVRHGWIFEAMRGLRADKMPIDFTTVVQRLEDKARLSEIGGAAYILSLTNKTPSWLNVEGYGRIVEKMALRRRLIEAAGQIARLAHSDETDLDAVLNRAQLTVQTIGERRAASVSTVKSSADLTEDDIAEVQGWAADPQDVRGSRCNMGTLDLAMGGWEASRTYMVAGPPGVGKSALLGQMVLGFAETGDPMLYFALEMPAKEVRRRMVCARAHVDSRKLKQGKLTRDELERYVQASRQIGKLPIFFEDRGGLSLSAMKSLAQRYYREHGIKGVVVDTLQKVADIGRTNDLYAGTTHVSVGLANWFRNSDYFGLLAGQINRASSSRADPRPLMSDLRDSGSQEQDLDGLITLYREAYYNPEKAKAAGREHVAEAILRKNRYGEMNFVVEFYWQPTWPGFAPLQKASVDLNEAAGMNKPQKDSLAIARQRLEKREAKGGDLVEPMPLIDAA